MRKEHGLTLIELMVTLAVAVVLLSIGVPSFQSIMQSNRVSAQTNELISAVTTARSEAVRRNEEITLETNGGGTDWSAGFVISDGTNLRVFDPVDSRLDLDVADSGGSAISEIAFRSDGTRDPGAGNVTFEIQPTGNCLGDMRRRITVTVGGSTRSEQLACN